MKSSPEDKTQIPLNNIEIERKYKVQILIDELNLPYHEVEIYQTYLTTQDDNIEERVRKIIDDQEIKYVHTIKKPISDTERIEDEKTISELEYNAFLKRKNSVSQTIHKKRKTFNYKGQNFELDTYFSPQLSFLILELEGIKNHQDIDFPPFIEALEDVTGNKAYSNHSLSLK
ncbi:hypothetical protein NLM59_00205 [Weeksellaceae bacterium KMM 9724]|uniref:CYTH domain-containing protein n=1 Tax=Profundicola chukchiensis TaxID=2961959 RepID=UPI0024394089|nr:CYTH domain-containing protein [Profundicola chukchiensis]MDG4949332.1 hypothetical protein [Profundicola chukchiensis]